MKKKLLISVCVLLSVILAGCGADTESDVTTIPEVSASVERADDSDIIEPGEETTDTIVDENTTDDIGISPSNGGIGIVVNQPTRDPDNSRDDVEMWINGDGTYTYSLAWREIWLTCSTNVFDDLNEDDNGPYYIESVPAERFGWEKVEGATFSMTANGTTYVIKPNELISGSPTGTSAYAGIYYSDMNSDFAVTIRNPDATLCTYGFWSSSQVWNLDSIVFFAYMCEAGSINPGVDMFEGIIPDYFDQGYANGYTITYQSISD